jgi:uncharacterized membrane protein YraQ (UPF0718 family)
VNFQEDILAAHSTALNMDFAASQSGAWRSRTILIVLMAIIASVFWVDSRYPALLKRYHAGTEIKAKGALTFGTVYAVDPSMPYVKRVWRTTVNWLDANRAGMTFSFLFGPAALALFSTIRRRRTNSRYLNTLLGAFAGAPLGVCSNCIAPIARGFYASGMSRESVMAAMFASPALNVVVLAMTFALFPLPLALFKLATVLFLILVFVPAITARQGISEPVVNSVIDIPMSETWAQAFARAALVYAKSFWKVFRVAFPLMILAAVLGAFAVELIPQQALHGHVTALGIAAVAIISAFLPVPMAFDVAISYILMAHGVPLPYVAAILCTLGIISVYSLLVMGKTISWKIAAATYGVIVILGIAAGFAAQAMG